MVRINDSAVDTLTHEDIIDQIQKSTVLRLRISPIIRWRVELERAERIGYGFGIRGGKDFDLPLYILRIMNNSQADNSCLINVGDVIEAINGNKIGN